VFAVKPFQEIAPSLINMNNLKKIGLTALAGALVSVSASAEVSVSGAGSISFAGEEQTTKGNGWSMNDGITFTLAGEMDNGWNVTVVQALSDDDQASDQVFDTRSLAINMGDTGTLTFFGTGGSSVLDAKDDVTPNAGEEAWADVTSASAAPGGVAGNNMFHYSNSSLMDGMTISAAYQPSNGTTDVESSSDFGIEYTGIDGLTIGAAQGEDNSSATAGVETSTLYVTYAMDAFTVGYQTTEDDSETADSDVDFSALGISYAVSEDVSVSLNSSTHEYEDSTKSDQEATGVSVSYTMGSMTFSANHNKIDNVAGTSTSDKSGYAMSLAFTF
jgi:outer membrane protein OmpU